MELKPGTKLRSAVCSTEVIVVRPPADPVELCCGGVPMADAAAEPGPATMDPAHADGTLLGKRYAHSDTGVELLCTKQGTGSLSIGAVPLGIKDAKPLPASD
jgi:hypothetical protein